MPCSYIIHVNANATDKIGRQLAVLGAFFLFSDPTSSCRLPLLHTGRSICLVLVGEPHPLTHTHHVRISKTRIYALPWQRVKRPGYCKRGKKA